MAVSIEQAAQNALAAHLQTQLGDDVTVYERWPEPDVELPPKAISLVRVGPRRGESVLLDPMPSESRELTPPSATQKEYRFALDYCTQRLQLDCWATCDVDLDDIKARLDVALRKGPTADQPVRDGLLLQFNEDDGHEGYFDVTLLDGPDDEGTPDRVQRGEWRTTFMLELSMHLSVWAVAYRQAQIILQSKTSTRPPSSDVPAEETTVLPLPPLEEA